MEIWQRIEAKLDALLKTAKVEWKEPEPPAPRALTESEKQAIANAPKVHMPGMEVAQEGAAPAPPAEPVVTDTENNSVATKK